MDPRVHLLGIRHHGPGSSASLLSALDELRPRAVLIEIPKDAAPALSFAANPGMKPPVALLLHDAKDASRAAFYPFVHFSPEWQAMLWAASNGCPVVPIDLPFGSTLKAEDLAAESDAQAEGPLGDAPTERAAEEAAGEAPGGDGEEPHRERPNGRRGDPLDAIASAAGHSDGEAWWDALIERRRNGAKVFGAVAEVMRAAREAQPATDTEGDLRDARREAHMRLQVREALASTEGPIAVVVGAWHVPALEQSIPISKDKALLKGLRPKPTSNTWVPWTDRRMTFASGYRAGIESPGWYRHLWEQHTCEAPQEVTSAWMAKVARTLRAEGHAGATSSSIDAARLAVSLASLRAHPVPGLSEMQDATLGTLCHGDSTALSLIRRRLVVGEQQGEVAEEVPLMPLAADLQREQKRLRLKPESLERTLSLDLRSESGLARSTLLHRLLLLDVPWGKLLDASRSRGTFREQWNLVWEPELSLALTDALRFGNTLLDAAVEAARQATLESSRVADVADIVSRCLLADLEGAAQLAIRRLQALASNSSDVLTLMEAVTPLADILRYGTARRLPEAELRGLVEAMTTEVTASFRYAVRDLDREPAAETAAATRAFERALGRVADEATLTPWHATLAATIEDENTTALVGGTAARLLFDGHIYSPEEIAGALSRALSPSVPPDESAQWLEGFLGDEAAVLIHDPSLLRVIDDWLSQIGGDDLIPLLPPLRRAFVSVGANERRHLLRSVTSGVLSYAASDSEAPASPTSTNLDPAFDAALPLLLKVLGLEPPGGTGA